MPGTPRYHAPPVSYPVGRCLVAGVAQLGLCLLLLGTLAASAIEGADPRHNAGAAWALGLGLTAWLVLAGAAASRWWRCPRGRLSWHAGAWQWCAEGHTGPATVVTVRLTWDGQGVLLLQTEGGPAAVRWLWLERRSDAARWDDLRRAVWAARRLPQPVPEPG